jgi:O-antigen/teichoic acid export membrane protein
MLALMDRLRKIIGNTVISLLGQGVTWTSTLILTIAYGRFLGDIKFGELYFAITFVALIGFPIEFGFNQQLTRDVAQEPSRALRYLSNILCIKVLLWLLLYGCILVACRLLGYPVEVQFLVAICGFTLLSGSIANTFSSLHYAFERVTFPVIGTILEKGLGALIGILALRYGAGVQVMAWVLLGGSLSNVLWQAVWAMRLIGIPNGFDLVLIRELVRKSIPFLVYGVLGVIYYRIDTVFLSLVASAAVVGWYGAGYRIFDTLVFLPSLVIGAIMYPIFSKLSLHSEKDLKIAAEKSMNFLLFFGIPIAVGLIVAAPNIIGFLYHRAEFVHAIPVMQLLAPGLVFLYVNSVFSSIIISTRHEKNITIMAGIALVFNVGLNIIAIPMYEHIGAAAVTSLTEFLLMCLAFVFVPRALWPIGSAKVGAKAIAAGLVMALAIWTIRQMNLFIILPVAMVAYLVTAALLGTIPREDLKALYTSIRNKAGHSVTDAPIEENANMLSEEALFLTDEDLQPKLDSAFAFRLELTDPVMPAYGYNSHSSEIHPSKKDIKSGEALLHKEIGISVYEDTLRRKALHIETDPLKDRAPSNAEGDTTLRLRVPRLRLDSLHANAPSNAEDDDTIRIRPLRLRKEFKHMVFGEQEEVKE